MTESAPSLCIVAAVNDERLLTTNLMRSPVVVQDNVEVRTYRHCRNTAEAYNRGIDDTTADLIVFAHQDVYLPRTWRARLSAAVAHLDRTDPRWAVLGPHGITSTGEAVGVLWCGGQLREVGQAPVLPTKAVSFDEMVLVVRRQAGLRFDPQLPSFHLYGTDIAQSAIARGFGAYAIDAPLIHNTKPVVNLAGGYTTAYRYMQRKWSKALPLPTSICAITRAGLPLYRVRWRAWKRHLPWNARKGARPDAVRVAEVLGYE